MKRAAPPILAGLMAVACSPSAGAQGTPKLHPTEAACVSYEMTGQMQSGTMTRCHRNWGYEIYEVKDLTVGFAGFSQTQKDHTITIGDTIYNLDLEAGTGTKTVNPMYDSLASNLDGSSVEELTAQFTAAMGMTPTGETRTIAGAQCSVYASQMMGTVCLTDGALTLEQNIMGMGQVATEVSVGDGGDDANYTLYETVTLTEGPDLSDGLSGLFNQ